MAEDPSPWTLLGRALDDYQSGRLAGPLDIVWEDGQRMPVGVEVFFRGPDELPDAEAAALELCRGRVLDAGAGAGSHALALQERGLEVTALDVCPQAVDVMRRRGVRDARLGDVFDVAPGELWDTVLLLMNGIGLVGTLTGLDRFLERAVGLVAPDGQILLDSADLRFSDDPHEPSRIGARERLGRYRGETRQRLEYDGVRGSALAWLYLDAPTLRHHARRAGWELTVVFSNDEGDYLARLRR